MFHSIQTNTYLHSDVFLTCLDDTQYSFSQQVRAFSKEDNFLYFSSSSERGISLGMEELKKVTY